MSFLGFNLLLSFCCVAALPGCKGWTKLLRQREFSHQRNQGRAFPGGGQQLNIDIWVTRLDVRNQQRQVFTRMFANPQKQRKYSQMATTCRDKSTGCVWQRRLAQLQIGAAHLGAWLTFAHVGSYRFNGRTPQGIARAMSKQKDAYGRGRQRSG